MPRVKTYHVSRLVFLLRYIILAALIIFGVAMYMLNYSYAIYVSSIGIGILGFIILEFRIRSNRIIMESDGITLESGTFSRNKIRVNYGNISDIRINQTMFQRMFGYGDIEIGIPGSFLQQNFAGRGDIRIETKGLYPGIVLKKFQKVDTIENIISSNIRSRKMQKT
ncbi:MAG: PH domain-containing protein [Candidatus Aenigmatarchaeota archaeon]